MFLKGESLKKTNYLIYLFLINNKDTKHYYTYDNACLKISEEERENENVEWGTVEE